MWFLIVFTLWVCVCSSIYILPFILKPHTHTPRQTGTSKILHPVVLCPEFKVARAELWRSPLNVTASLPPDSVPTRSTPPLPAPFLSVQPSSGVVQRGDTITFSCLIASPLPQNHRPASNDRAMTFVLLRSAEGTGETSVIPAPPARQASSLEPLPGVFSVGPVRGQEEEGQYTCIYQVSQERGQINSTVSNKVLIQIAGEKVLNQLLWLISSLGWFDVAYWLYLACWPNAQKELGVYLILITYWQRTCKT